MAANFNFSLGFNVEKEGINKAKQELAALKTQLQNNPAKFNIEVGHLQESMQQISVFQNALTKAFNPNLNKLDTRAFMKELHEAGYSLDGLKRSFSDMGIDASRSMGSIERGLQSTNLSLKKTNKLVDSMADTFLNTLKWNVASQAIHGIEGSVSRAVGFIKNLDNSLNNIRIVTGKSKEEMNVFAESANKAAGALGKTTVEYTDASLIYFQQGKSAADVRKLTEATLIGSSITGEGVSETAELLTAALNGYNLEANKSMEIMDKFAAVGAGTGSDFNELAIGFSKVASMAKIAGVNVDQLNGMLATISTTTREAPESIGTSLKTIFGRMTDLQAGKADEDGWKMGKVNGALEKAGFSMMNKENGELKNTGVLIEEIGNKWKDLNKETQLALSTAMAGSRQQNRLIALFNNWEDYQEAVKMSQEAEGTAYEQNIIRMDSVEYKSKQLRAAMEEMWMKMLNSDAMGSMLDFFTDLTQGVNTFIDALGGIGPILTIIGAGLGRIMSGKISNGAVGMVSSFKDAQIAKARDQSLMNTPANANMSQEDKNKISRLQDQYKIRKYLTQEEHKEYIEAQKVLEVEERKLKVMDENIAKAKADRQKLMSPGDTESHGDVAMARKMAENEAQIKSSKTAFNQLSALRESRIEYTQINKATMDATGLTKQQLLILKEEGTTLDALIEKMAAKRLEAEKENEVLKRNKQYLSDEYALGRTQQNSELGVTQDVEGAHMSQLSDKANAVGKVENVVNGAMSATVAITGLTSAMTEFNAAGSDTEKQSDAVAAGIESISAALLMSGNPYAMAAGAILGVATAVGKFAWENTGLRKTIKDNKALIEDTTKTISDAKTQLQNLGNATQVFADLNTLMKDGKVNLHDLGADDLAKYYELANKLAELAPQMVAYYDDQGNAVIDLTSNLEDLRDAQREQIIGANQAKTGGIKGFAEESSNSIKLSKEKIKNNQEVLDAMAKGEKGLADYNAKQKTIDINGAETPGEQFTMDDMDDLTSEVQKEQASLQKVGEDIKANIVSPLFDGNRAFKGMTAEQQKMSRALLTTAQATELVNDPKHMEDYGRELTAVLNLMGRENALGEKKKVNLETIKRIKADGVTKGDQLQIDKLVKENKQYDEQIKKVSVLNDKFEKLGQFKQTNLIGSLGTLGLEGKDQENAVNKMSDYYSKNDVIGQGPMTAKQLRKTAGQEEGQDVDAYQTSTRINSDMADLTAKQVDQNSQKMTAKSEEFQNADPGSEDQQKLIDQYKELKGVENDLIETQSDYEDAALQSGFNAIEETKANAELEGQYWDNITAMAATTDGYNELAEKYNENLVSVEALGQAQDKNLNKGNMDEVANSLDAYKDKIPDLSDALEEYRKHGSSSFAGLVQYANQASEDMKQSNGRMYAAMNSNDAGYYKDFLAKNVAQTNEMFVQYGIRSSDYNNFGEYEKAVNLAKEGNKLSVSRQANNQATIDNRIKSENEGTLGKSDVKNAGSAAKQKITIWSVMTNSGLTFADKLAIGWDLIIDGITKAFAKMGNFVIDIWNGVLGQIASGINWFSGKVKSLASKLVPDVAKKAFGGLPQLGEVKFDKANHVSGTNFAAAYMAKTEKTTPEFNYDVGSNPTTPILKQSKATPGSVGSTKVGTAGPTINPNAGSTAASKKSPTSTKKDATEAKTQEDMKVDLNDYLLHDTNALLQKQDDLLKQLTSDEDKLYGKAKLANLKEQNDALDKKKTILAQQLVIIKAHASEMQKSLASQGAKFSADGTIENYVSIIKAKVAGANAIVDADAKKLAQDGVTAFIAGLKDYEEYQVKLTVDTKQALKDVANLQHEIAMKVFEYKITIQIELSDDQDDMLKFLKDVNSKFEDISNTYQETVDQLGGKLGEVAAIQDHINETLKDSSLTDKERIETLDKYEKLMQATVVDARKLQEELVKINETAIKDGIDLLDQQLNKYDAIGNTLDYISQMINLTGNQKNFGAITQVYETQAKALKAQLNALIDGKKLLQDMLDKEVKGSEEWEYTNEQLIKMDEQIQKITEQTLKTFQEEFNNSFTGIMEKLDKELSNGMGLDKLSDQWSDAKADGEKYLSTQEKIIWAGNMQYKIQTQMNEATNPDVKKKLQEYLDDELATLKEKNVLTQYDVDRAEKLYNITQAQIALDEARNNKTIQRLVRDSSGNWSYQYVEDTKKVATAQDTLSSTLQDLMDFDKKAFLANQDEMLAAKEQFEKDIQDVIKRGQAGEFATQTEFNAALEEAQANFSEKTLRLETEGNAIRQGSSESTMAAIYNTYVQNEADLGTLTDSQKALLEGLGTTVDGSWQSIREALAAKNVGSAADYKSLFTDVVIGHSAKMTSQLSSLYSGVGTKWNATTGSMGGSNASLSKSVASAIGSIKFSWSEYQTKVTKTAASVGMDMNGIKSKTTSLGTETKKLTTETDTVLSKIQSQWAKVGDLIKQYQNLKGSLYDSIINASVKYITSLDTIIRKQKEVATGVKTPAAPSDNGAAARAAAAAAAAARARAAAAASAARAKAAAAKAKNIGKGSAVRVKSGRTWYYDSQGMHPSGSTSPYANTQLYVTNTANGQYAVGKSTNINSSLGWLKKSDLQGFKTGGYTGEFGSDTTGKLAMLHEKELVLNKADTKNILDAVQIVRDYASLIKDLVGGGVGNLDSVGGDIKQSVSINADFSGVKSSSEIEKAFENLGNRAAQFAKRK